MQSISLHNITPNVFAGQSLHSDVWQTECRLERGKGYLVQAASGTGKSTFCSYLIGMRNDYSGLLSFDGKDVREYSSMDWLTVRRQHISILFQELRLFPELTAMENIQVKNNLTHTLSPQLIETWLGQLGIADKRDALVGKMSYGQQQRVAFIRALAQPFDFLVADEPISHLDDACSQAMADILLSECERRGAGYIVTSIGKHPSLPYHTTLRL